MTMHEGQLIRSSVTCIISGFLVPNMRAHVYSRRIPRAFIKPFTTPTARLTQLKVRQPTAAGAQFPILHSRVPSVFCYFTIFHAAHIFHREIYVRPIAVGWRFGVLPIANQVEPLLFTWNAPFHRFYASSRMRTVTPGLLL